MTHAGKKWALFVLRWGIAVAGIWWVVSQMYVRDYVTILDPEKRPVQVPLASPATEKSATFDIIDPQGATRTVRRDEVVNALNRKVSVPLRTGQQAQALAFDLNDKLNAANRILVQDPQTGQAVWKAPADVAGGAQALNNHLQVCRPRVQVGIASLVRHARLGLLIAALFIYHVVYLITAVRWNALLRALGIRLTQTRTFVLTMVGCFYSTFMPGSTGGDLLKAYYASKQTPHRTHAVFSVLVDRILGLVALVTLGGVMATVQFLTAANAGDPAAIACRRIALGAALFVGTAAGGAIVLAYPVIRRSLGVDAILRRLPFQKHVQHIIHAMETYRTRPGLIGAALLSTVPVDVIVVLSALCAGKAFGLPLPSMYYFVAVPVMLLVAALPLAPQGAGVMEFFAILLTRQYVAEVNQAVALAMSIRCVAMFWNLTGGIFVLRGGYHVPTQAEAEELEKEEEAEFAQASR